MHLAHDVAWLPPPASEFVTGITTGMSQDSRQETLPFTHEKPRSSMPPTSANALNPAWNGASELDSFKLLGRRTARFGHWDFCPAIPHKTRPGAKPLCCLTSPVGDHILTRPSFEHGFDAGPWGSTYLTPPHPPNNGKKKCKNTNIWNMFSARLKSRISRTKRPQNYTWQHPRTWQLDQAIVNEASHDASCSSDRTCQNTLPGKCEGSRSSRMINARTISAACFN